MNKYPKQLFSYTGGKARYAKHILPVLKQSHTYVEPFLGAGSVLTQVAKTWPSTTRFIINDANPDLMNLYRAIQSNPQAVIDEARQLQQERSRIWLTTRSGERLKEHFYKVRDAYSAGPSAGKLFFLARTCYMGLWHPSNATGDAGKFEGTARDTDASVARNLSGIKVQFGCENGAIHVPPLIDQQAGRLLFLAKTCFSGMWHPVEETHYLPREKGAKGTGKIDITRSKGATLPCSYGSSTGVKGGKPAEPHHVPELDQQAGRLLFLAKTCFNGLWHSVGTEQWHKDNGQIPETPCPLRDGDAVLTVVRPNKSGDQVGIENMGTKDAGWEKVISNIPNPSGAECVRVRHAEPIDDIEAAIATYDAIPQPENVMAWHELLQRADLYSCDWRDVPVPDGATVYLDPPYIGTSVNYSQVNSKEWTLELLEHAAELGKRCQVVMTNKDDKKGTIMANLNGAKWSEFDAKHNTRWNAKAADRAVKELILQWDR